MIRDYYDIGIIFVAISLVLLAGRGWEVRLNQKSLAKHRCNKSLIFFLNQHECNTFSSLVSRYRSHLIQMHKATSSVCVRRAKPSLQQRPAPLSSRRTTLLLVNFRQKTYLFKKRSVTFGFSGDANSTFLGESCVRHSTPTSTPLGIRVGFVFHNPGITAG